MTAAQGVTSWPLLALTFFVSLSVQVSDAQRYRVSTLTARDAHSGVDQCTERVNIVDTPPPVWKSDFNLNSQSHRLSGDLGDISTAVHLAAKLQVLLLAGRHLQRRWPGARHPTPCAAVVTLEGWLSLIVPPSGGLVP